MRKYFSLSTADVVIVINKKKLTIVWAILLVFLMYMYIEAISGNV